MIRVLHALHAIAILVEMAGFVVFVGLGCVVLAAAEGWIVI